MTRQVKHIVELYELTEFPKLFTKTYWGRFEYRKEDDDYIKNRNEFAKKYNLDEKSWCRDKIPYEYKMDIRCKESRYNGHASASRACSHRYDHFECYRTKVDNEDSLILIISIHKSEIPKSIIDEQWGIVPPMYSNTCVTWQLIVPVYELKRPLNIHEKYYLWDHDLETKYLIYSWCPFSASWKQEVVNNWKEGKEAFDKMINLSMSLNNVAKEDHGECVIRPVYISHVEIHCMPNHVKLNDDSDYIEQICLRRDCHLVDRWEDINVGK